MRRKSSKRLAAWALAGILLLLAGCSPEIVVLPTRAALAAVPAQPPTLTVATVPATWTPAPTEEATPTPSLAPPTATPSPSATPWPSPSPVPATAIATATTTPSPLPAATLPPPATLPPATATFLPPPTATTGPPPAPSGANLLPNPSFEQGWTNLNGIPELQVPNGWTLEWDEGANPLDPDPWNSWVRPESRVLSRAFLPAFEHDLFIWQGDQTVKIFKEHGAISFRLLAPVWLEPGEYQLNLNLFPDLIVGYEGNQKIWAPDKLSGEVRLVVDAGGSGWMLPQFGVKNSFSTLFLVDSPRQVTVGAAIRGRWAISNNGWFLDDWSLYRLGGN